MASRPKIGIVGFSDGEPAVHEELKEIVQKQVDSIVAEVCSLDVMDLVVASTLVNSPATAKSTALEMIAQGVDGVIFSYGVFSFPNFSAIAAQFLHMPCLLIANLNPAEFLHSRQPEIVSYVRAFHRGERSATRPVPAPEVHE